MLLFIGLQRVGQDRATELNVTVQVILGKKEKEKKV